VAERSGHGQACAAQAQINTGGGWGTQRTMRTTHQQIVEPSVASCARRLYRPGTVGTLTRAHARAEAPQQRKRKLRTQFLGSDLVERVVVERGKHTQRLAVAAHCHAATPVGFLRDTLRFLLTPRPGRASALLSNQAFSTMTMALGVPYRWSCVHITSVSCGSASSSVARRREPRPLPRPLPRPVATTLSSSMPGPAPAAVLGLRNRTALLSPTLPTIYTQRASAYSVSMTCVRRAM
jgi:hypothetical protein